jgi:hypothetical protein
MIDSNPSLARRALPGAVRKSLWKLPPASILAVLVFAATATAKIVVAKGIGGVSIGESEAQVEASLGAPSYKTSEGSASSWGYPKSFEGRVGFGASKHVTGMWTISKHQRTSKGIGPGSSLASTQKAYPAAQCKGAPGVLSPTSVFCVVKTKTHGVTVETSFVFYSRKLGMREVDIGVA